MLMGIGVTNGAADVNFIFLQKMRNRLQKMKKKK